METERKNLGFLVVASGKGYPCHQEILLIASGKGSPCHQEILANARFFVACPMPR